MPRIQLTAIVTTLFVGCLAGESPEDPPAPPPPPRCDDGVANGSETSVDCGGSCGPCDDGRNCLGPGDCRSGVCRNQTCAAPTCSDRVANADEIDVDCGGPCGPCQNGLACGAPTDCASGVCVDQTCSAPSCDDGVRNADESDVDCGGDCDGCRRGLACRRPSDCGPSVDDCAGGLCVVGPTAGFRLEPDSGVAPVEVTARDESAAGDADIVSIEYDFGDGRGFGSEAVYTYTSSGAFVVRQRIIDANGLSDARTGTVIVEPPFSCYFSETDIGPPSIVRLTADRLGGDWRSLAAGGIRSACSVDPQSGVFYVEISRAPITCDPTEAPAACVPAFPGLTSLGIGTAAVDLDVDLGADEQSFGIDTFGSMFSGGAFVGNFDPSTLHYGMVVDYRGPSPILHFIADAVGGPVVAHTESLAGITAPVHAIITGPARLITPEYSANFGNDLTNAPFHFDPVAVLRTAALDDAADALVLGFGGSASLLPNETPTLAVSPDRSVAPGTAVTVTGVATDAEDGPLTDAIVWEDMAIRPSARITETGGTFTFAPTRLGTHPVRATVIDSEGARRQAVVTVTVTGAVLAQSPVVLDPTLAGTGADIDVDPTGLQVRWVNPDKMGIRANQGMIGSFQYFEAQRLGPPIDQGAGLAVEDGSLNPYRTLDAPASMSINTTGGIWQNIIYLDGFDTANDTYGFAVDYRGVNPTVYVIVGDFVAYEYVMHDAFVPVHPMLYGNISLTPPGAYDIAIRFTGPFVQDPAAALTAYGLSASDVAELELGWSG